MIIGLFPDLLPVGGVQMAGRHVAAVLTKLGQELNWETCFIALNDPLGMHSISSAGTAFTFRGYGRSKRRFVMEGIRLSRAGPKLVVAAHPNLAVPGALIKLRASRAATRPRPVSSPALIVCSHGIEVWRPLKGLRRAGLKRADLVLAPSSDTAGKLRDIQGVENEKIQVLHWGLDPAFVELAAEVENLPRPARLPKEPYILSVGRWASTERYKGFDTLVQVMPALLKAVPNLQLVLIGEGDDQPFLEHKAAEAGVKDKTHFISGLSREELAAAYRHCEVFALPSAGEGFGLVFLEAMSMGKPVIGGNHGGTPDIIADGVSGLLVSHGNQDELTSKLKLLLGDQRLRQKMGSEARERVRSVFSFARFSEGLEKAVSKLIGD